MWPFKKRNPVIDKSWAAVDRLDKGEVHVLPRNDSESHIEDDACFCFPKIEPVKTEQGLVNWLITHNAFDGREE